MSRPASTAILFVVLLLASPFLLFTGFLASFGGVWLAVPLLILVLAGYLTGVGRREEPKEVRVVREVAPPAPVLPTPPTVTPPPTPMVWTHLSGYIPTPPTPRTSPSPRDQPTLTPYTPSPREVRLRRQRTGR
jgi:hypothetical protein